MEIWGGCVLPSDPAELRAIALDGQGRIVAAGVCIPNDPDAVRPTMAIVRNTSDGEPDTAFGGGKGAIFVYNHEAFVPEIEAMDLAIDSEGRYVVTGSYLDNDGKLDMITLRLKP